MDRAEFIAKLADEIAEIEEDMAWTKKHDARFGQRRGVDDKWTDNTWDVTSQNERLLELLKEAHRVATEGDD